MRIRTIRTMVLFFVLFVFGALLLACTNSVATPPEPESESPELAEELVLYNWEGDNVQEVMDAFTEEYGVEVTYVPFDSQEEAVSNIVSGESYDVVVLEHSYFPELIGDDQLAEIDFQNIPNFKNIWANFRDLNHDPGNVHSVPFTWGSTFLIYREDIVTEEVAEWNDLWSIQEGAVALRDTPREAIGLTLKSLGYSLNSEEPAEIEAALEKLLELKDNVIFVGSSAEEAVPVLADGTAVALVGWAEDIEFAQEEGVPLDYTFPQEGVILWGDNFVIPANSNNKYTAEVFLDFLMRPEINATIVNETYYATTNEAAQPHIDAEIRENPLIFPPVERLKKAEVILPLSQEATQQYNEAWATFQAAVEEAAGEQARQQ